MSSITFDKLAYIDTLTAAGVDEAHARAQAAALDAALTDTVATKNDIERLESRIDARLSNLKADMMKLLVGLLLGQAAVIVALMKLL